VLAQPGVLTGRPLAKDRYCQKVECTMYQSNDETDELWFDDRDDGSAVGVVSGWTGAQYPDEKWRYDVDARARRQARDENDLRQALGMEDVRGYQIVGFDTNLDDIAIADDETLLELPEPELARTFPCLDGHRYTGCLGMACPLDTCWTGGATISFSARMRERTRVSTAVYLPGVPCHTCAHVREDTVVVPAPRPSPTTHADWAVGSTEPTAQPTLPAALYGLAPDRLRPVPVQPRAGEGSAGRSSPLPVGEGTEVKAASGEGGEGAALQRVTCGCGLWEHAVSLSSFVTRRIPMLDQETPEQCPSHVARAGEEPHPAVVAHLERRRARARERRADQRALREGE